MRWVLPLIILLSCQRHSQWQSHTIHEKNTSSTRIVYRTRDQVNGIDIEFIKSGNELVAYLQVHSEPMDKPEIKLITEEQIKTFIADFHEGRQRIRLSDVLQAELISALKTGNPVTIELAGYRETIDPTRFEKVFKRLDSDPSRFLSKFKVSMMG